jgi:hypothetical protein
MSAAFRSILHMTAEEAKELCATNNLTPFAVYEEPARLIVPDTMKSTPNRAELEYYLDATDTYRVGKATIYRDGIQIAEVVDEECDECGGECDGVHARMFNIHELLGMTDKDAKKYCASHKIQVYCLYGSPGSISVPKDIQNSSPDRVEIFVRKEADEFRVVATDFYNDGRVVNTLRGDYLAPKVSAKDAAKEARVKQLADAILKNEKSIVEEVIRQMDTKRVSRIIDVLSVQDPDVVTEVVAKLKGSTYNSAEDMRKLWKSYGK